jgi:hypothetical protein
LAQPKSARERRESRIFLLAAHPDEGRFNEGGFGGDRFRQPAGMQLEGQ